MAETPKMNLFFSGMDLDSEDRTIGVNPMGNPPGSYRRAKNVRISTSEGEAGDVVANMRGNTEIPWSQPPGENTCIGTYWDEEEDTQIAFIWNSLSNHHVVRYYPIENVVRVIAQGPIFNFSRDHLITGINLVDKTILQWTDGNEELRQIDIKRADNTDKKVEIRGYFQRATSLVDSRSFSASVINNSGQIIVTVGNFYLASQQSVFEYSSMIQAWVTAWNGQGTLSQYFTAESCGEYVKLTATNAGPNWNVSVSWTDTVSSVVQPPVTMITEYENRYNDPWVREQINRAKPAIPCAPAVTPETDPDRSVNLIERRVFQFAYALHFVNGERSSFGPISEIPQAPVDLCGGTDELINCIDIDFSNNSLLVTPATRGEIEAIEIFVREHNEGFWKAVEVLRKEKWIYTLNYKFYNDGLYPAIDPAYPAVPYWNVPLRSQCQEVFADIDDNNRALVAGVTENFDNPCVNGRVFATVEEGDIILGQTVDLIGRIKIVNPLVDGYFYRRFQPIHQLDSAVGYVFGGFGNLFHHNSPEDYGQSIPTGGFPVYIAGTDHLAISRQHNFLLTKACGTLGPTIVPGSPNVYDTSQTGTALFNPCNKTHRSAVREGIEAGEVYSTFRIKNVPVGRPVVIRVADPRCGFLNDGSVFDLNSTTRAYQKTSAVVVQVGDITVSGPGTTIQPGVNECVVNISPNASGDIDIGNVIVVDATDPGFLQGSWLYRMYFFDADGTDHDPAGDDIRNIGTPAEKQLFIFPYVNTSTLNQVPGPVIPGATDLANNDGLYMIDEIYHGLLNFTDHNGHCFFVARSNANWRIRAACLGVSGDPLNPGGSITGITTSTVQVNNWQILNNITENKWRGGISGSLTGPDAGNLNNASLNEYVVPNLNAGSQESIRTHVELVVQTPGGSPISDVLGVIENGKYGYANAQGELDIIVYGDMAIGEQPGVSNDDRHTTLLLSWNKACSISFTGGDNIPVDVTQFEPFLQFSETFHLNLGTIVAIVIGAGGSADYGRGSAHDVGLILIDAAGRKTAVWKMGEVIIPDLTEDLNKHDPITYPVSGTFRRGPGKINWEIRGDVPVPEVGRFTHYMWCITQDSRARFRLMWAVSHVDYVERYDDNAGAPVVTSFNSNTASEIYLYLTDSFTRFREINSDALDENESQVGYEFTPGDRVRIYTDTNLNYLTTHVDLAIKEQRGEAIIVAYDADLPELKGGEIIRIVTPKREETEKTYYEIPTECYEIIDPYGSPSWSQINGVLTGGDTWTIASSIPVRPGFHPNNNPNVAWTTLNILRESDAISDFYSSTDANWGRVNFEDPDAEQIFRPTAMRWSNPFQRGTSLNGLSAFEPLNIKEAPRSYGLIQRTMEVSDVIVCPCSNSRTFAIYIGRSEVKNQDGSSNVILTDSVLGTIRPFQRFYGTIHPESMVRSRGESYIKWIDAVNGVVVRYSKAGLDEISRFKMASFFREKCKAIQDFSNPRIWGGISIGHNEYYISFASNQKVIAGPTGEPIDFEQPAETLYFNEDEDRWISFLDLFPEFYGQTKLKTYTWKDGKLYLEDSNENRGEFHGVQFPMYVDAVANEYPDTVKIWLSVAIKKGAGWHCPLIETNNGQLSNLIESDFKIEEFVAKAGFLRDQNTPNVPVPLMDGDALRSETIQLRLQNDSIEEVRLFGISVLWARSEPT